MGKPASQSASRGPVPSSSSGQLQRPYLLSAWFLSWFSRNAPDSECRLLRNEGSLPAGVGWGGQLEGTELLMPCAQQTLEGRDCSQVLSVYHPIPLLKLKNKIDTQKLHTHIYCVLCDSDHKPACNSPLFLICWCVMLKPFLGADLLSGSWGPP